MAKLFAVVVATVPEYYEYKKEHPEHDRDQLAWFRQQEKQGKLLCCGLFFPHDGTGLWVIQAENLVFCLDGIGHGAWGIGHQKKLQNYSKLP